MKKNLTTSQITKSVLKSFLMLSALAGITAGITAYTFHIDDEAHQPFVNKANENPAAMNATKQTFVMLYEQNRMTHKDASVFDILKLTQNQMLKAMHKVPSTGYHPRYNPYAPLANETRVNLVFEDLGIMSQKLNRDAFENLLPIYANTTAPVLTLADNSKKVNQAVKKLQANITESHIPTQALTAHERD